MKYVIRIGEQYVCNSSRIPNIAFTGDVAEAYLKIELAESLAEYCCNLFGGTVFIHDQTGTLTKTCVPSQVIN